METYIVELTRPNKSVTWGFSIQGGKEFGCPLSVLRVTPNSISDKMTINVQDLILKINDIPADTLTHRQAIEKIQNLDVKLELGRPAKVDSDLPPPPQLDVQSFNNNCRISTSINELPPPPPEWNNLSNSNNTSRDSHFPPPPQLSSVTKSNNVNRDPYFPPPPEITNPNYGNRTKDEFHAAPPPFMKHDSNTSKPNQPFAVSPNTKPKQDKSHEVPLYTDKNKEQPPLGLGHFLQNQDQKRDNRDLIIQRPDRDSNFAICYKCKDHIKGAYIEANNKVYCSNHFCCSYCNKPIKGTQFIETKEGTLYCMEDFKNNVAPRCSRCTDPIIEHQIMALGKCWHPDCFLCNHCKKPIPQGQFHIKEENNNVLVYCEKDFKDYYELKCFACKLAIDSDDKYLLYANNNYHVECLKR